MYAVNSTIERLRSKNRDGGQKPAHYLCGMGVRMDAITPVTTCGINARWQRDVGREPIGKRRSSLAACQI